MASILACPATDIVISDRYNSGLDSSCVLPRHSVALRQGQVPYVTEEMVVFEIDVVVRWVQPGNGRPNPVTIGAKERHLARLHDGELGRGPIISQAIFES